MRAALEDHSSAYNIIDLIIALFEWLNIKTNYLLRSFENCVLDNINCYFSTADIFSHLSL